MEILSRLFKLNLWSYPQHNMDLNKDKWTNYFALGPRKILHATRRRLMLILHYSFTWLRTKDIFEAKITSFLVQVAIQITLRLCNVARATFALYNIYCWALVSKNIRIIIHEKKHLGTQITAVWEPTSKSLCYVCKYSSKWIWNKTDYCVNYYSFMQFGGKYRRRHLR